MLEKREIKLLSLLSNGEYNTAEKLSNELNLSSKTIRNLLKELDRKLKRNGGSIESKHSYGFKLVVDDLNKIYNLMEQVNNKKMPNNSEERIQYLLEYLLYSKEYIKLDNLSEILFISKKTLTTDLKEVEKIIKKYNLRLERKPYHGIKIIGKEFDLRSCMAKCLGTNLNFGLKYTNNLNLYIKEISKIVIETLDSKNFKISDIAVQNLIIHIYIAIKRIKENSYISIENFDLYKLIDETEISLAKKCVEKIEDRYHIKFPGTEIEYISIHLASKKIVEANENNNIVINQETYDLVKDMIDSVYKSFKFDFRNDLDLIMMLGQHLIPLKIRLYYDMKLNNPLLKEIKERYSLAYAMGVQASTTISKKYGKYLDENEIGYIALSFALALERQKKDTIKKNILLVCSSGKGSAQLLKYKIKEHFSDIIDTLQVCDIRGISKFNFKDIDYVFTTVPINENIQVPIQEIKCIFEYNDVGNIKRLLKKSNSGNKVMKYYDKNLFLTDLDFKNKEEVLEYMCNYIKKYREIPDNFYVSIMKREKLAQTEFGNMVSFPHPHTAITNETFVCVGILNNPIKWNENMVQIIFLVSIANKANKDIQTFYRVTSKLLLNKQYLNRLIKEKRFNVLENLILEVECSMEENNG